MIQEALNEVLNKKDLSYEMACAVMAEIMDGTATNAQMGAFLAALRMKGETVTEITACAEVMREKGLKVEVPFDVMEIVGTGGDEVGTFNISTTSAFVVAAGGVPVAKHGNRSVSSKSGAADVLESLGVKIQTTPEQAKASVREIGISFLFAQSYHGAMKYVAPARKELGIRTVFNVLGPLTNPASTNYILLGVYEKAMLPVMARVLLGLGIKSAMIVYGNDRLDEVSISDKTSVAEVRDGKITEYEIAPEDFGFPRASKEEIVGGIADENAKITRGILDGSIRGAKRNIVLMNAGCALYVSGKAATIADGIRLAEQQIDSGKALEKLHELVEFTNRNA